MIQRILSKIIKKDLQAMPAVVLYGPRQVGKTTLVRQLTDSGSKTFLYLDMESTSDRARMTDPELFLSNVGQTTIILDEVQNLPGLFPVLRSLIDRNRKAGRFLLLGSASPELIQQSSESLAGRVRYRELFPLILPEVGGAAVNKLWLRGGFPKAFLSKTNTGAQEWLTDFVYSYTSRDLRMLGLSMQTIQIQRLLQMLAHMHGQLLNNSNLSRSLGVSVPTIINALYYLEEAMLIRSLKPWHSNLGKRLVKTPKVYIRDTGMLHNLLSLENYEHLMGHPQAGSSWEGFVIQQIFSALPRNINAWFYRSHAGAEIDLLLSKGNSIQCAIEIKLTNAPEIRRGHTEAAHDLKPKHKVVIIPAPGRFPLKDGWEAFGIWDFLKHLDNLF